MSGKIEISNICNLEIKNIINSDEIMKYRDPIEYESFFINHLEKNIPCVFGNWLTKNWKARKYWVNDDATPNKSYLIQNFGTCNVPVANCEEKYYNAHKKNEMQLKEYLKIWNNKEDSKCLYLKDWHFMKDYPFYDAFNTPCYFGSDWLNEYWLANDDLTDDYRFVYIGPKGSWTPFHADVFGSYSWSTNICGRKRWLLFSPGEEINLKDKFGSLVYDVLSPELRDEIIFPKGKTAPTAIEVIQEDGESIFIPSGWHHQVHNMEDTISINHNWINGTNINFMWKQLMAALNEVENSISDCKMSEDWTSICQCILKAHFGMDIKDFASFIYIIAERRINLLKGDNLEIINGWTLGVNHIIYDMKKLMEVLERMLKDANSETISTIKEDRNPAIILEKLESVL